MTFNNLLEVFTTFEWYHRCGLKYSVEFGIYLQDTPVSILNFRYFRECSCSVVCYWWWNSVFVVFFSLHVNSSFLSVLSSFLICSSRTSSYCQCRNFCFMITENSTFVYLIQKRFSTHLPTVLRYQTYENKNQESDSDSGVTIRVKKNYSTRHVLILQIEKIRN